jgi:hypothetical protein
VTFIWHVQTQLLLSGTEDKSILSESRAFTNLEQLVNMWGTKHLIALSDHSSDKLTAFLNHIPTPYCSWTLHPTILKDPTPETAQAY